MTTRSSFNVTVLSLLIVAVVLLMIITDILHCRESNKHKDDTISSSSQHNNCIPGITSLQKRNQCIEVLVRVGKILSTYNITYMLAYGTLFGSYIMKHMLPWDDEIYIFVNIDDRRNIQTIFQNKGVGNKDGIRFLDTGPGIGKLYSVTDKHTAHSTGLRYWVINISFYITTKDGLFKTYKHLQCVTVKYADVFPLTPRSLAWDSFPAPRRTKAFTERHGDISEYYWCLHNWVIYS